MCDQIELTNEDIQGIVSLRFEKGEVKGETQKQVLQRLNPTVVLDGVNKMIKVILNHIKWLNIAYTGHSTPV